MKHAIHIVPGLPGETFDRSLHRHWTGTPGKPGARCVRGFSLIEIMTVVVIICLLIGIFMAGAVYGERYSRKMAIQSYLGTLSQAVENYYADFNFYPDSSAANTYNGQIASGSSRLAEALVGYLDYSATAGAGDGAGPSNPVTPADPKYGFRMNGHGKIYGPYVTANTNNYSSATITSPAHNDTTTHAYVAAVCNYTNQYFIDPLGQQILYYRAQTGASVTTGHVTLTVGATLYFGAAGIFNPADNLGIAGSPNPSTATAFLPLIGNTGGNTPASAGNNKVNAGESPINTQTFLLVSPGTLGNYFDANNIVNK